jgi:hypothetical protein
LSGATTGRANGFSTLWLQVPDVSQEETRLRGLGVPLGLSQGLGADRTAFGRSRWPCGDPGRSSRGPFSAASAVAQVSCRAGPASGRRLRTDEQASLRYHLQRTLSPQWGKLLRLKMPSAASKMQSGASPRKGDRAKHCPAKRRRIPAIDEGMWRPWGPCERRRLKVPVKRALVTATARPRRARLRMAPDRHRGILSTGRTAFVAAPPE